MRIRATAIYAHENLEPCVGECVVAFCAAVLSGRVNAGVQFSEEAIAAEEDIVSVLSLASVGAHTKLVESTRLGLKRRRAAEEEARRERRRAAEEAKRRSELERYYRMRAAEENQERERQAYDRQQYLQQQRWREQQEAERELQRQAHEHALRKKQQREEEEHASRSRRARAQAEAQRRRRQQAQYYLDENSHDDQEQEFNVVQSRDGRLYRVRNPNYHAVKNTQQRKTPHHSEPRIVRGDDGNLYRFESQKTQKMESPELMDTTSDDKQNLAHLTRSPPMRPTCVMDDVEAKVQEAPIRHKKKKSKKGKKKKITVIVENASDSENDDDYRSPWRNRRPSPGQWIEPVENFQ
ncbi:MAG: hypothetical protein SGILL_000591 [Bacillariaceae sp.]